MVCTKKPPHISLLVLIVFQRSLWLSKQCYLHFVPRVLHFSALVTPVVTMASNVYFGTCKCYSVFMSENPTARQKIGARRRSQKLRSAASLRPVVLRIHTTCTKRFAHAWNGISPSPVLSCGNFISQMSLDKCKRKPCETPSIIFFFFFFVTSTGVESSLLGGQIREFEQALGVKPVNNYLLGGVGRQSILFPGCTL